MTSSPSISWSSDHTLRIALGDHSLVRSVYELLRAAPIPALRDITPAATTILLTFDALGVDIAEAEHAAHTAVARAKPASEAAVRTVEIPVCYEGDCAPDLAALATMHAMTPLEVIALHTGAAYRVEFLGFSPGFAYLAGLPLALATPRLERPRVSVPAGSVGIAGEQTGVYPHATPGGWRLIGRTPLVMFDPRRAEPSLLQMGDNVRFVSITRREFDAFSPKARAT